MLRGRGFSMRATLIERIVRSNKVQKMAGFITKRGRGIVRSVPTEAEAPKKSPERARPLGAVGCAGRMGCFGKYQGPEGVNSRPRCASGP